jgi:hypothetical protein
MYRQGTDGGPIGDPPSEPSDPLVVDLRFTNPPSQVKGPWNGVTVVVTGTAKVTSGNGAIDHVEVRFGAGAPYAAATQTAGGWTAWTASQQIASSGVIEVAARVLVGGQVLNERTITISTVLDPKPAGNPTPPADTTPPTITIASPANGAVLVAGADHTVKVTVSGTAADVGSGLDHVELLADGVTVPVSQVNGTWANWTATAALPGLGVHAITAKAVDRAGLSATASVQLTSADAPPTPPVVERLFVVERCMLSSFLGAYGPGKTIKTLTLLPGEKTTINVKTYQHDTETATESASILDSNSTEAEQDFENTLQSEQSNKQASQESSSWDVKASASASWGFGSASISGGAAGASNASREELAKNVSGAVQKHAAKASSKRELEIKSSREMKTEEGQEFSSQSTIENINVGRTLNFVFRQMNQEYLTFLHLVDVRIGYVRGDLVTGADGQPTVEFTYREATLSQLDGLLRAVIVPEQIDQVRRAIVEILSNVFDYQDARHVLLEEKQLSDAAGKPIPNGSYLRVPRGLTSTYADPATGSTFVVPGVILAAAKSVMRTDGIVCDAFLGQGDALDDYSKGLQAAAVTQKQLENAVQQAELDRDALALQLVRDKNADGASVFHTLFQQPAEESLALVTASAANGTRN